MPQSFDTMEMTPDVAKPDQKPPSFRCGRVLQGCIGENQRGKILVGHRTLG
jgi:hypothetical protein